MQRAGLGVGEGFAQNLDREQAGGKPVAGAGRLAGRVAVVTGSSRGIGRSVARALADEGAAIAVHYRREALHAQILSREIDSAGGRVRVLQADLSRPEDCHRLLDRAARELGPIDILVNSPGVTRDRSVRKMSAAEWDEVLATNLSSVFYCTKTVLEPMIQRGFGRVINIASLVAQTGAFGQANYAAAQAGVIAFSKSLAQEVARNGITVNAICPGQRSLDRPGEAEEVARLVRFLCTDGDWITGAQLNVHSDGPFL
jgi:NAD(P)-dependent dehydrogenase (short-subunit alcohol dehydrogenase family)